jgi:predicted PurR-regulated permease PerM
VNVATSERDWPASAIVAARLVSFAILGAVLYFGQAVLVPLVLAALVTFLLSPLVTRLDRLRVPRVVGVIIVMTFVGAFLGGLGYVVAGQLQSFATELPTHRHNIRTKIRDLVALTRGGAIENVQDTIEDISAAVDDSDGAGEPRAQEPMPVAVQQLEPPLNNAQWLGPLFGAVGTFGLTLLLAMFMLINREDLRNRLVSISGRPSLAVATKAFADAGARISRYLLMQFVINATMGLAVGIGLYFIGVPYAALWGLTAAVLRYIPYVGPWIAALLPITVSLVTAPGWEQVAIVVGMFLVLELLSNNVMEPLLYGHSVGLSTLAVIVAAIFWTWLWGPIGLVIATPITACLVVLSSYVPELEAIGRLLGDRPALKLHESLYQRLLARDVDEADSIITRHRREKSLEEACELVLRTLLSLKRDLQAARVGAEDGGFVIAALRESVEDLRTSDITEPFDPSAEPPVLIVGAPGRDPLDALVLELARVLVRDERMEIEILSTDLMVGEALATIAAKSPAAVLVPSLPPAGLTPARHLCLRLHARTPGLPLIAARLGDPAGEVHERVGMLEAAGCSEVASSLAELRSVLQRIARSTLGHRPAMAGPTLATANRGN